jgi:uncharacterized protein with NAD-binding domain and iron-sulfur cluster
MGYSSGLCASCGPGGTSGLSGPHVPVIPQRAACRGSRAVLVCSKDERIMEPPSEAVVTTRETKRKSSRKKTQGPSLEEGKSHVDVVEEAATSNPSDEIQKKKVIVIGGGFAGFAAAKHLSLQDNVEVTLLDAQENPGGLSTAFKSAQGRTIEAGVKGFWYDYPNINRLCDELEIQPFTDFLTSGFWAKGKGDRLAELVTEAPVFSSKPQLPTILGQFFYTAPLFYNKISFADRLTIIPWLYDVINIAKDQSTYEQYDRMTAREMFKRAGVSDAAYNYFLKPTLAVGLFAPPEELSAAVTLELLCFYALNSQNAFDVKWCKGPVTRKIFTPLVNRIGNQGGIIQGKTFVTKVNVENESSVTIEAMIAGKNGKSAKKVYTADAVIFALSISGMKKIIANSPALGQLPEFANIMNLRSIDCIATKIWYEGKNVPTRFPANVLADFETCGATYFNLNQDEDNDETTAISADFYGASALLPLSDEEIIAKVHHNICQCDPVFKNVAIVDSAVVKFPNAVTHFSPGSLRSRPDQITSFSNVAIAGDYVKNVPHGANGLSQERAWVTGLRAANLILRNAFEMPDESQAEILPSYPDEPFIALLKDLNKSSTTKLNSFVSDF